MTRQGRLSSEFRGRTKGFASGVIRFFVTLPKQREEVRVLGRQLLRSGTSVAAHVREAGRARSDAEFCSKLEGAAQEADESQLWLELLRDDCAIPDSGVDALWREAGELIAIIVTMVTKTRTKAESGKRKTEMRAIAPESNSAV
jgi:four helix bundle protein